MKYIIANWKANKNISETLDWIDIFTQYYADTPFCTVILCVSYPLLYPLKQKIASFKSIFLGSQDISLFEHGPYTGEVSGKNLSALVEYAIIGHSERREHFHETEEVIEKKVAAARKYGIKPILCIRNTKDTLHEKSAFITFEPESAISTGSVGKNVPVEDVITFKHTLTPLLQPFIYGGSVDDKNAHQYLQEGIDGVLIGAASLNPYTFYTITKQI